MPELTAPTGWELTPASGSRAARVALILTGVSRDNIEELLLGLRDWATENGKLLVPEDYDCIEYVPGVMNIYCWTKFKLQRESDPQNEAIIGPFNCTGCNKELRVGQVYCEDCDRFVVCDECHLAGLRLYGTQGQATAGTCAACSAECETEGCVNRQSTKDGYTKCPECDPRGICGHCAQLAPLTQLQEKTDSENRTYLVCPSCLVYVCAECNAINVNVQDRAIGEETLHICEKCAQRYYDEERAKFEKWSDDEIPVSGNLVIPSSLERPIRTISVETEFDGDGVKVGKALASAGLVPAPDRDSYRSQGDAKGRYPCLLKSDSSVTGGELVTYLVDLDNEKHAAALLRMTEVMRGCRELGLAEFSTRAGGHIHIDLHGLTARDLWGQYTLFKYLELPIFHLAGAGAEYGHRSLEGSGYAHPGPEGPFGTVGKFAQSVLTNRGDRWALHFGNFAYAKERCECGAYITGEWASCTCNLGKATAEWRVFNSDITPRILHAWIALVQAITAYATDWEGFNEDDFPVLSWDSTPLRASATTKVEKIKERLEWIFRELPLTLHERDSLIYACKRSQLSVLGEDYLNNLINVEQVGGFGQKKPAPNPGSRKDVDFELVGATVSVEAHYVEDFYQGEDDDYDDGDDDGYY